MNLISKIQHAMTLSKMLKIELYGEYEVAFSVWESEAPILVNPASAKVEFESVNESKYNAEDLEELAKIMRIIQENMKEVQEWVKGWNDDGN